MPESIPTVKSKIDAYLLEIFDNYNPLCNHHHRVLPKGRSFTANSGTKAAVLLKGRSSTANSRTQAAVSLGMDRFGSFPLLSVPHSLFSIWADLKRSEKIPGAAAWRWGEWFRLSGPSGLNRNSPQGLNISSTRDFDQIRDPEIPITLCPPPHYVHVLININILLYVE